MTSKLFLVYDGPMILHFFGLADLSDKLTDALRDLKAALPREQILSEQEKDQLIADLGYGTVQNILKAKSTLPIARIPFLFNTIDTQKLVNVLGNDLAQALRRAARPRSDSIK